MCSNCKDVAKGCRPKLHEPTFCPLLRASYCSICCSKGHYTADCPNTAALEYRKPQFMEQLIPFCKLQEYGITSKTPLPSFKEPPSEFECPISQDIMEEPVVACKAGHVFNKADLELWCKNKTTCPVCRGPVSMESAKPNHYLKNEIQSWKTMHPEGGVKSRFEAVLEVEEDNTAMRNILMNYGKPLSLGISDNRKRLQALATELKLKLVFISVRKDDAKSKDKKGEKKKQTKKTKAATQPSSNA